jgi:hypothetical protein
VHGYVDEATTGFIDAETSRNDIHLIGGRYVRTFEIAEPARWGLTNLSSSPQYPPPGGGLGDWHALIDGSQRSDYALATNNAETRRGNATGVPGTRPPSTS